MRYQFIHQSQEIFETKRKYSIEDNNDIKLLLAYIREMKNTTQSETSVIDKTVLLTKSKIGRR